MDVKLEDEEFPFDEIITRLNACLPGGLRVFDVTEAVMKAGKIAYASFTIHIGLENKPVKYVCAQLEELFARDSIEIEKKSKKGLKTVDIKPGIKQYEISEQFDYACLDIVLSAGSSDNVNPNLLITALEQCSGAEYEVEITRNDLYNSDMELFR
jgi:radical SAM-linked protein